MTYLDYIMFQIHHLFNESEKVKVTYKCDRRKEMFIEILYINFFYNNI